MTKEEIELRNRKRRLFRLTKSIGNKTDERIRHDKDYDSDADKKEVKPDDIKDHWKLSIKTRQREAVNKM